MSPAARLRRSAVTLLLTAALVVGLADAASADVSATPAHTWGTNGRVLSILSTGGLVYVAGSFSAVVDTSGASHPAANVAVFDPADGTFDPSWGVSANDTVNALAVSAGVLYLGGNFTQVDGVNRRKLAAVDISSGSVTPWQPTMDGQVDQVTVVGGSVYASGAFANVTVGGTTYPQPFVARFDATSGAFDQSWRPAPDGRVRTVLGSTDGSHVYLGGDFSSVSGASGTVSLASLFTISGAVDTRFRGAPTNQTGRPPLFDLATDGTRLVVAATGGGGACTALDASTGALLWTHHANGDMQSVRIIGSTAYCGGHYSGSGSFDGFDRNKLAAVDLATGSVLAFAPKVNSALGLWSMGADATHLYVGGDFTKIGPVVQGHFAQFSDNGAQGVPLAPRSLAGVGGDSVANLSWVAPTSDGGSKVQQYRIYRAVGSGTLKKVGTSKSLNYADPTVQNGVTYTYAVSAKNAVGEGPRTAAVTVTPMAGADSPPGAPTGLSAASLPGSIGLSWTAPAVEGSAPVTAYQVLRSSTSGTETLLVTVPAASTSAQAYTDTAVDVATRYFYVVRAVTSVGAGAASNEVSQVPSSGVPSAPVLSASVSGGRVVLGWTAAKDNGSPVTKYTVVRNAVRIVNNLPPTTLGYTDSAVVAGTTYQYQVRAANAVGNSKFSNTVIVTVPAS